MQSSLAHRLEIHDPKHSKTNIAEKKYRQKILIIDFDIFGSIGGGQTVYKNIILNSPDKDFYYFVSKGSEPQDMPRNVTAIPFKLFYRGIIDGMAEAHHRLYYIYQECANFAKSIQLYDATLSFDVVDTPDYRLNGLFVKQVLEQHNIPVGHVALALHGTLSAAWRRGWPGKNAKRLFAELHFFERMQLHSAASRYAISNKYAQDIQKNSNLSVHVIDPLSVVRPHKISIPPKSKTPPDLAFIGRRERWKGPDIFLDLAWSLPAHAYSRLLIIGPDGPNHLGRGSDDILTQAARLRGIDFEKIERLNATELDRLQETRIVTVLPSRHDTFNLTGLESLMQGAPVLVSQYAGLAGYIREKLPELSDLIIDLQCDRSAAPILLDVLSNYDRWRERTARAVSMLDTTTGLDLLDNMYDVEMEANKRITNYMRDLGDQFALFSLRPNLFIEPSDKSRLDQLADTVKKNPVVRHVARTAYNVAKSGGNIGKEVRRTVRDPKGKIREVAREIIVNKVGVPLAYLGQSDRMTQMLKWQAEVLHMPERTSKEARIKLHKLSDMVGERRFDRLRLFRELMRLERRRGNDLVAATYALRIMRWLGSDRLSLLDDTLAALQKGGFSTEADVADLMYRDPKTANTRIKKYLQQQQIRHLTKPDTTSFEIFDDRRGISRPKVTVIVSLYNAANKIELFCRLLMQQTLLKKGQVEFVFVDSASPTAEYEIFKSIQSQTPFPALFVRTHERETIQMAWNRAIKLARGEYLSFLGVDEGIHPECLDILSAELDRRPEIDWMISNAMVTEVDRKGQLDHDVMLYDRRGYRQDWVYLDTTFLSWVGGLYRKSLHERFGYYDESFRGAGDTEFKNRVGPFIKSAAVEKTLGVFNNFPEERTTQHPRAEIEDLRAWYLHRTPGGMDYAFENRDVNDAVALFRDTLRYRKCYCQHWSTDLDLGRSLAVHLGGRSDRPAWAASSEKEINALLQAYRGFELSPAVNRRLGGLISLQKWRAIKKTERHHQALFGLEENPAYDILNDNRYEQHWWSWSTD
ncbi:MAG: glycosyltransferase [Parvibaculaceae bacterium]|nr:glycosyltransferase [Parvibaculaceae bacterium]